MGNHCCGVQNQHKKSSGKEEANKITGIPKLSNDFLSKIFDVDDIKENLLKFKVIILNLRARQLKFVIIISKQYSEKFIH